MAFELDDGEEIVSSFVIDDIELSSQVTFAMKQIEALGTEIRIDIDALELKKAQHDYMTRQAWAEVWKKYPDKHPSKIKVRGNCYYKYDVDESTVKQIKVNRGQNDQR